MLKREINYKNGLTGMILLVILGIIYMPNMVYLRRHGIYSEIINGFILCASFFLLPYFLFFKNLRIYFYCLFVLAFFTPLELLSLKYFQTHISIDMLGTMRDTNLREALDFLRIFSGPLALVYTALLVVYYISVKRLPKQISLRHGLTISLCALVLFFCLSFNLYRKSSHTAEEPFSEYVWANMQQYEPFRLASNVHEVFWSEAKLRDQYAQATRTFKYHAIQSKKPSGRQIFVLCIGESSRFDHWGINGYFRNTSPHLTQRKGLYVFPDMVAAAVTTRSSIPMLLTRAEPDNFDLNLREPGFIVAMKECGFRTYWISAQEKYGASANLSSIHSADADSSFFYRINAPIPFADRDIDLLAKLKSIMERDQHDLCIIFHTNGSHSNYDAHCDDKFKVFRPLAHDSIVDYLQGYKHRSTLINSYDNTILQSDAVLDSLIALVDGQHAISSVLFISDHGENLFDNNDHRILHGGVPTVYTAHVPMFLWLSDLYKQENNEQIENIERNYKLPLSMTDIFHTSLDLFNIKATLLDSSKSFANKAFKSGKRKVLGPQGRVYIYEDIFTK